MATWTLLERGIFIKRRARRSRRTGLTNRDRPSDRITIGRCRDEVEELRDRLVIAARSSRDRGAIEP